MKVILHKASDVHADVLFDLQGHLTKAFNSSFTVEQGKGFKLSTDSAGKFGGTKIFDLDAVLMGSFYYYNLDNVTTLYPRDNAIRVFFLTHRFYHSSIRDPDFFMETGRKLMEHEDKISAIDRLNGTVNYPNNHVFLGGVNQEIFENYFLALHEIWHAITKDNAHCTYVGEERCIMNPSPRFIYPEPNPDYVMGSEFCPECLHKASVIDFK